VRGIAEGLKTQEGALLPILHALNERFGYVDERAAPAEGPGDRIELKLGGGSHRRHRLRT